MAELIILGKIPGTSIHISFLGWLAVVLLVLAVMAVRYKKRRQSRLWSSLISQLLRLRQHRLLKRLDEIAL